MLLYKTLLTHAAVATLMVLSVIGLKALNEPAEHFTAELRGNVNPHITAHPTTIVDHFVRVGLGGSQYLAVTQEGKVFSLPLSDFQKVRSGTQACVLNNTSAWFVPYQTTLDLGSCNLQPDHQTP